MLDLLTSTAALSVVLGLIALLGLGLTVLPFVASTRAAERRGLSVVRVGTLTVLAAGVGLAAALVVLRSDLPASSALLPLLLGWAVPGALGLLGRGAVRLGGRRGLHE